MSPARVRRKHTKVLGNHRFATSSAETCSWARRQNVSSSAPAACRFSFRRVCETWQIGMRAAASKTIEPQCVAVGFCSPRRTPGWPMDFGILCKPGPAAILQKCRFRPRAGSPTHCFACSGVLMRPKSSLRRFRASPSRNLQEEALPHSAFSLVCSAKAPPRTKTNGRKSGLS